MIRRTIDFFFIHAKCCICGEIGHKRDMTEKWFHSGSFGPNGGGGSHRAFYHYECREKTWNERLCECGKNWVKKKPKKKDK